MASFHTNPSLGRAPGRRPGWRARTPEEDWHCPLPTECQGHFDAAARELETALGMVSIALDETVERRIDGQLVAAREQARCTAQLLERLHSRLRRTLAALSEFGSAPRMPVAEIPEVDSIHAAIFRHPEAHRTAVWHACLFWLLYGARLRYAQKVRALEELLRQICADFRAAAEDLADGTCIRPLETWELLEILHADLHTCVQEVIVLLRSLFRSLPEQGAQQLRERILLEPAARPTPR
jgi:hypothetical protein